KRAGRGPAWMRGGGGLILQDSSCVDRKFALNAGVGFHTPEEYFLQQPIAPFDLGFDPASLLKLPDTALPEPERGSHPEMIVLVGPPAAGKSTVAQRHFAEKHGYVRVNRDELKSESKCLKKCEESLAAGECVVIDNTNPTKVARHAFLALALAANVPVRCIILETPLEICFHLNMVRERTGGVKHIPAVAYNIYRSKYEEPDSSEGFSEIVKVPFSPSFDVVEKKTLLEHT
ncbi:hypothetical protein CYMTET_32661, partial [Cymbomonas tetramitiformis]